MKLRIANISRVTVALFVTCLLACGQSQAEVKKAEVQGIRNFSQLDGSVGYAGTMVGFGGGTEPAAQALLKERGFKTVINLRLEDEENVDLEGSMAAAEVAGLNYIHHPFDPENSSPAVVESFLELVGNSANQPVYIHCNSATRVGALWMIGRMLIDKWSRDTASREVEMIAASPEESIAFAMAYLDSRKE